jgi:hypothetical protein
MQRANKGLILTVALLSVFAAVAIYQIGEIDAGAYRALRDGFKRGTPEYRSAIAAAMHSGEINRWEYRHLVALARHENSVIMVDSEALNLREERLVLTAMTRQVKTP